MSDTNDGSRAVNRPSSQELLRRIASKKLHVHTLQTQNSDDLDFHDIPVWGIKEALEEAFNAGYASGMIDRSTRRSGDR